MQNLTSVKMNILVKLMFLQEQCDRSFSVECQAYKCTSATYLALLMAHNSLQTASLFKEDENILCNNSRRGENY